MTLFTQTEIAAFEAQASNVENPLANDLLAAIKSHGLVEVATAPIIVASQSPVEIHDEHPED